jgi:hypothetical protein
MVVEQISPSAALSGYKTFYEVVFVPIDSMEEDTTMKTSSVTASATDARRV